MGDSRYSQRPAREFSWASKPEAKLTNVIPSVVDPVQTRIAPRTVGTGSNRGELIIKGLIKVVDTNNNTMIMLGYKKESF
jgi:hypothetical protein